MQAAGLEGVPASPKGLRHGFGVAAVTAGIPLNLVQKWLGHAQLSTTAIYANAVGAEEKDIARRMWLKLELDSDFYQLYEMKDESGKFRATWHHTAGGRGVVVRAAPWRAGAGRSGSVGSTAATRRRPL